MRRIEIIKDNEIRHYVYPTAWTEVTIAQYAGLFSAPQHSNPLDRAVWMMRYFTNITEEDLFAMRISEINAIASELDFIHTTTPESESVTIEAGGWSWRRRDRWDDITYGLKVSLETIQQESDNPIRSLPKLLCMLLERFDPATEKAIPFNVEQLSAADDFAELPITKVAGVMEGFLVGTSLS